MGHSLPCLTLDDLVRILTSHGICARIRDVPTQNDVASKCLIAGVSIDSRRIEKGELFICKGAAFKSSYLISAIEQGAAAYLCEEALADELAQIAPGTPCIIVDDIRRSMAYVSAQAYNHPDKRLQVFGITGTKGKSTTSYMLKSIFEASGRVPSILGSINTEDGIESFESHHTTPEAPDLWRHLSNTEQVGRDTVVMEVSSQALKYDRTLGLSFTVGCFLNIERDHISPVEHKNFDDYFSSKLKLFAQSDTVVINLNSHYEQEIIHAAQQNKRVVTFGVDRPEADYCALHLCAHDGKVEFDLIENAGRNSCTTPAPPLQSISTLE